jgi:class 3 adenylate cyclase/CHASE2 domain-containing sensor protein
LNTNKKRNLQITILLIVFSFIAAHFCFRVLPDLFETWNAKAIDRLFLFRASSPYFQAIYDDTIAHIDITDTSLQRLKSFYLNRSHYARVIRNLAAMNASLQLFDFIFIARSNDSEDRALIDAAKKAGNVYMGLAFNLSDDQDQRRRVSHDLKDIPYLDLTKWDVVVDGNPKNIYEGTRPIMTFPELASASRGLGFLNLNTDRDGVNRRIPLLVRYKGAFYPSLSFRSICDYLNVPPEKIILRPGKSIKLQDARRLGETSGHDIVIPIDRHGNMLIEFIGPWERMKHYNFADVFYASDDREEMDMWRDELSGKILLVSEVTTGVADLGPVPTDAHFLSGGIHANVLHTILRESFLRELSGREMLAIEISLLIILLFLSLLFSSLYFSLGSVALAASYVGIASAAFLYGNIIFHIVRPLFILAFAIVSVVVYRYIKEEKDRHFIRRTFGRYLSNEVVEELLGSPEGLKMSGETRDVTLLVSDLRGFTPLSSRLSPEEVIQILNHYFERMVDIIMRYRGTVDELQGDGILVFFGAPLRDTDDPERSVACAIEMQKLMPEINETLLLKNLPPLSMGIGINTGEVVVGNIGSEKRTKYGAVGSAINTTYRIESYTTGGQILISPSTYHKIQPNVLVQGTMEVRFKGIDQPVTLYDVKGIKGTYEVSLPEKPLEEFLSLEQALPITCFAVEGKAVSERAIPGRITGLSPSGAEALLDIEVGLYSNLKILLVSTEVPSLSEIYAKVTSVDQTTTTSPPVRACLRFTSLPEDAKRFFDKTFKSSPSDNS